jgi:hypothetical protein
MALAVYVKSAFVAFHRQSQTLLLSKGKFRPINISFQNIFESTLKISITPNEAPLNALSGAHVNRRRKIL